MWNFRVITRVLVRDWSEGNQHGEKENRCDYGGRDGRVAPTSQGVLAASSTWKKQGVETALGAVFQVTQYVAVCISSHRSLHTTQALGFLRYKDERRSILSLYTVLLSATSPRFLGSSLSSGFLVLAQPQGQQTQPNCVHSFAQLGPPLCNPMGCSTPGFLVLHYLPEFAQTHVHWVSDAI